MTRYVGWISRRAPALVMTMVAAAGCAGGDRAPLSPPAAHRAALAPHYDPPPAAPADPMPDLPEDAALDDYLAYAEQHSPALRAAHHRWQAERQTIAQARALPDPRVNLGYEEMDRERRVGVSQEFPWFGTTRLRGLVAEHMALMAMREYDAARLGLRFRVTGAYAEYAYVLRAVEVTQRNVDLAEQLEQTALARFRAGGPHADVIRAQVERARAEDDLREIEAMRTPAAARLNAVLARPADAPLPLPVLHEPPDLEIVTEQILARLEQTNPELRALRHEMDHARWSIELSRKEFYPDFMIGVDYMRSRDMDGVGVMASIALPIWRRSYRAGVREAHQRFYLAAETYAEQRNRLEADLHMAHFRLRDAERKIALYRDRLIPLTEQAIRTTDAAYRAGTVDFLTLVENQRLVLEFDLALARALADRTQRLAELEMLIGQPSGILPPPGEEQHERSQNHEHN